MPKMAASAMSAIIGSTASNPFDLLKTRMMASEKDRKSVVWHISDIYKNQGFKGLYKGF